MATDMLTYEQTLLVGWEEVYRKSQLSLLMLLALKDGAKYTAEIKDFILATSRGLQTTDEQSLYRALRRYHKAGMVAYDEVVSKTGPNLKRYKLTELGMEVLSRFLQRNIIDIFYNQDIQDLIKKEQQHG